MCLREKFYLTLFTSPSPQGRTLPRQLLEQLVEYFSAADSSPLLSSVITFRDFLRDLPNPCFVLLPVNFTIFFLFYFSRQACLPKLTMGLTPRTAVALLSTLQPSPSLPCGDGSVPPCAFDDIAVLQCIGKTFLGFTLCFCNTRFPTERRKKQLFLLLLWHKVKLTHCLELIFYTYNQENAGFKNINFRVGKSVFLQFSFLFFFFKPESHAAQVDLEFTMEKRMTLIF